MMGICVGTTHFVENHFTENKVENIEHFIELG
jgi:hypothetical protein